MRKKQQSVLVGEVFEACQNQLYKGLPQTKLKEAIHYLLVRKQHFETFLSHGDARIDNNPSERAIKPFFIGRKNWLFVGSKDEGKSMANIFSLVQTCRNLGVNPQAYLEDVLVKAKNYHPDHVHQLLPQNWGKS